jgi:hypothetical protein
MAELSIALHPAQRQVYNDPSRFKVLVAGRRWGKTELARVVSYVEALRDTSYGGRDSEKEKEVWYIAPTFEQGRTNLWTRLKKGLEPLGNSVKTFENTCVIDIAGGRRIRIKGADNPDSLRGIGLAYVILDEYADMDPRTWEEIIRPALMDGLGGALFIGTPKGKNHFFDLFERARITENWSTFQYASDTNPFLEAGEIQSISGDMSSQLVSQELLASFISRGGKIFKEDMFLLDPNEPQDGYWIITADIAGFATTSTHKVKDIERRDNTAVVLAKISQTGWWIKDIKYGKWDPRETSLQILSLARSVHCQRIGIEKGTSMLAILPYMTDLMRQYSRWLDVTPLTHGNKRKYDRIQWALQGRMEKGKIRFMPGKYLTKLIEEAVDFPDPRSQDDLLDALAYVDQMATITYIDEFEGLYDQWKPLDDVSGY